MTFCQLKCRHVKDFIFNLTQDFDNMMCRFGSIANWKKQ